MNRLFIVIIIGLVTSCSEQNAGDPAVAKEDHALALAAAMCGSSQHMPWLRAIIRKAETNLADKGQIYAVHYSGGVAIVYQRSISSCLGCLVYDCQGDIVVPDQTAANEIILGTTPDNVIYSSF